jgi:hypothetical protein
VLATLTDVHRRRPSVALRVKTQAKNAVKPKFGELTFHALR